MGHKLRGCPLMVQRLDAGLELRHPIQYVQF